MTINITARFNEKSIVQALREQGVDFDELVEHGQVEDVRVDQTGGGAVFFEVTVRTYAIGHGPAQKILGDALI